MYFGYKRIETGPNYSHEPAIFLIKFFFKVNVFFFNNHNFQQEN